MIHHSKLQRFCVRWASCLLLLASIFAAAFTVASAQEFRGVIVGKVVDQNGGVIPNAKVSVRNQETNVTNVAATGEGGGYRVPFLLPGNYEVIAEVAGFKKTVRQNIALRVNDQLEVDLTLETGSVTDAVTISSDTTPLLNTETASSGQVVDRRRINDLPLQDGNPFSLTRLAPTMFQYGTLRDTLPFNLAVPGQIVLSGAFGGSEFSLDGIPNQIQAASVNGQREGTRPGYQPPADAVEEFKVTINSYDAQEGHTVAANINATLRSGKNAFFGTAYEFLRNEALNANEFFSNRAGRAKQPFRYNRYGGSIGGPVRLPKRVFGPLGYDGRDRTFFFYVHESLPLTVSPSTVLTVPTERMRNGDFSELLAQNIRVYDPDPAKATRLANGQFTRAEFAGNLIPANRLNPVSLKILALYPLPNQPGNAQQQNNYFAANPAVDEFGSDAFRIDHSFTANHKTYFRFSRNHRVNFNNRTTPEVGGIVPTAEVRDALSLGGALDHVWTISPTFFVNLRAGLNHYLEKQYGDSLGKVNIADLGFSTRFLSQTIANNQLPRISVGGFNAPATLSRVDYYVNDVFSFQPTVTKIAGRQSFKFGYDVRSYQRAQRPSVFTTGQFAFNGEFTRAASNSATLQGQGLAQYLLGIPSSGAMPRTDSNVVRVPSQAGFVQDDWKLTSKLTLNLGLRYEYDGTAKERFNRAIARYDINAQNPIEAAAQAAYAARPIPEIAAANFRVRGGTLFADGTGGALYNESSGNFSPRIGAAYALNSKTVLRGGIGWYTNPFTFYAPDQTGYSLSTPIVASTDNNLTPLVSFGDPFPGGILEPVRNTLGLASANGLGSFYYTEREHARSFKYTFFVQRELPGKWVLDIGYNGAHGFNQPVTRDVNALPLQYLSRSLTRDVTQINFLNAQVPNPFLGLTPLNPGFSASVNTTRAQLLRPYPHLSGLSTEIYDGTTDYHALVATVEHRFAKGFTLNVAYTFSKMIEELVYTNPQDTKLERFISTADAPHRLAVSGIWELPFGKGRKFASHLPGVLEVMLGGWQTQGIYIYQSGAPLTLPNFYYNGDVTKIKIDVNSKTIGEDNVGNRLTGARVIADRAGFYTLPNGTLLDVNNQAQLAASLQLEFAYRTLPRALANLRQDEINNIDLSVSKNFTFAEKVKLQFRAEFLNAFNHPIFNDPSMNPLDGNFGRVLSQRNLARNVQLGLKLSF